VEPDVGRGAFLQAQIANRLRSTTASFNVFRFRIGGGDGGGEVISGFRCLPINTEVEVCRLPLRWGLNCGWRRKRAAGFCHNNGTCNSIYSSSYKVQSATLKQNFSIFLPPPILCDPPPPLTGTRFYFFVTKLCFFDFVQKTLNYLLYG
jgi:hypothetical protein